MTKVSGPDEGGSPFASPGSLKVAALLTVSGGFLDAFTYMGHGKVFANAMTANVVFLGVYASSGDWSGAFRHLLPIIAFLVGVFIAHCMALPGVTRRWPQTALTCLIMEIICLSAIAFLPQSFADLPLVLAIALVAAMQNSSFSRLESWAYNSVTTTGNLRGFAGAIFDATIRGNDPTAPRQARVFGLICLCFLVGAAMGAFATPRLHNLALLAPVATLAVASLLCWPHGAHKTTPTTAAKR